MDVLDVCMRPVRIRSVKTYSLLGTTGEVLQNETLVVVVVVVVAAAVAAAVKAVAAFGVVADARQTIQL
jgi:hypothetical protein